MKPARLAEPGERFVVFGANQDSARHVVNGDIGKLLDVHDIDRYDSDDSLDPTLEPYGVVTLKKHGDGLFALPRRWLYALDGDEPVSVEKDEEVEA